MRDRLHAMNEQKVFLCDQLKALMKRNKILKVRRIDLALPFLSFFLSSSIYPFLFTFT
jgi:hypothetical protein